MTNESYPYPVWVEEDPESIENILKEVGKTAYYNLERPGFVFGIPKSKRHNLCGWKKPTRSE